MPTVDTRDDVVLCIARVWDSATPVNYRGHPVPFAAAPFAETDYAAKGQEQPLYFSDRGLVSGASDDPAHTAFSARLMSSFNFELRAFAGERPGGRSAAGIGAVVVANGDARLDGALRLGWDGRALEIKRGKRGDPLSAYWTILRGTAAGVDWDEHTATIRLRDRQTVMDRPIAATLYGGGGGLDGDTNVAGRPKPQAYGECFNVAPVLIAAAQLIYQFHDRIAQAVLAVRDNGVPLTAGANYADYTALANATVAAGTYATALAAGLIGLGAAPAGQVTADVRGDALGGYASSTAAIVRRIVTTRLGPDNLADPTDLDTAAFAALDAAQSATVGYYAGTETVAAVLDALLAGIGGFWSFTRDGRFTCARLTLGASPVATIDKTTASGRDAPFRRGTRASWRERVAWRRNWTVQSADALAASVGASLRDLYSRESSWAVAEDAGIRPAHMLASEASTPALFASQAAAAAEAARLLAVYGVERDTWQVRADSQLLRRWLGETVRLDLGRFGGARDMLVIGLAEDTARGNCRLELFG